VSTEPLIAELKHQYHRLMYGLRHGQHHKVDGEAVKLIKQYALLHEALLAA
jgi:hypothetical protein